MRQKFLGLVFLFSTPFLLAGQIYSHIDSEGRHIFSDKPITEEQKTAQIDEARLKNKHQAEEKAWAMESGRREHIGKLRSRSGLAYVVNEEEPYTGVIYEAYENGQLKREVPYKDGKEEGVAKEWYENGQLHLAVPTKAGKMEGVGRAWHENGQLQTEDPYKDGKKEGIGKLWHENGQLLSETTYKDGERDGVEKLWLNGLLFRETTYKAGKAVTGR